MLKQTRKLFPFLFILLLGCNEVKVHETNYANPLESPGFNADSAYQYVQTQLNFGPRVPNTEAHKLFGDYLVEFLIEKKAIVSQQFGQMTAYTGKPIAIRNITARFNPENHDRIMFFAHWDTRFIADLCTDSTKIHEPFDGANDGASGVAVLMEMARLMGLHAPNIGVDLVFFDTEDQGDPIFSTKPTPDSWCLGSQYWSLNLPNDFMKPRYGVLLDMVGAKNARFVRESSSEHFAPRLYDLIWKLAAEKKYDQYFVSQKGRPIIDDHVYVSQLAKIRSVAIINNDPNSKYTYGNFWHTHHDNINIISKKSLKAVGQTMTELVYYY